MHHHIIVSTWALAARARLYGTAALIVAIAAGTYAPQAAASPAQLTLDGARQLAVDRSRQLVAQDYAVSATRDLAIAAGQLPDPVLKVGVDNVPLSGGDRFSLTGDFMTMRRVGLMQELTRSGKRQLRAARLEREAEKTLAEKRQTSANIERDTALAWLERFYAEAMARVIAEQGTQARLEIEAANGAYRGGRASQSEVLAARSAFAAYEDRASELRRRVRNATTMLARWIGPAAELALAGKPTMDTIGLDAATLERQLAQHPQVLVLSKQEEIVRTDAQLAQANKQADWSVEVAYQQRGPSYSNMVSIELSVPLQWDRRSRQDRELSARRAMVEQAKAEREEALRGYIAETRAQIGEWENNRERSGRYERELVPLSLERTAATLAAYRGGKASLADVLAARRGQIDVQLQALQLEADTARLWAQLVFLLPSTYVSRISHPTVTEGAQ